MVGEDRRFRVDDLESLDLRPIDADGRDWELSFTTPEGEQVTVELPSKTHHKLLTLVGANSQESQNKANSTPSERSQRQEPTSDTQKNRALLPEDSTLELEKYVSMHRALGDRERYEILWLLIQEGEMSLETIEQKLPASNKESVVDHVETLCDASLIERWARTERESTDTSTTYQPTVFGRVAVTDGIQELVRAESGYSEMYDSDDADEA